MTQPKRQLPDFDGSDYPPPPPKSSPAINAPTIVLILAGAMVGAHILFEMLPQSWTGRAYLYMAFNPAHLEFFSVYPVEVGLRWIGHTMVHLGWTHVIFNALFLIAFGTPIARQIPLLSFVSLFFLGSIGGLFAVLLFYGNQDIYVVGASGGVSAMIGALARMIYVRRGKLEAVPSPFNNRKHGTVFVIFFFVTNFAMMYLPGPNGAIVSGEGHIGSFVAGFVLSLILPWHRRRGPPSQGVSSFG